jgi:hypothetical protein
VDLTKLLGSSIEAAAVRAVLRPVGEPEVTEIEDETYYEFANAGFSLTADQTGRIIAAHLYPEGRDGYRQYRGTIPCTLRFGERRDEVHARLGTPTAFGGGDSGTPSWERYDARDVSCHIEYVPARNEVGLVTIMLPKAVPPSETGQQH